MYFSVFFDKTLYSSPLMVVTDQEYSKHYFIEGERVCTKIGGGFWGTAPFMPDGTPVDMLYGTLPEFTYNLSVMTGRHIECTGYAGQWDISPSFAHLLNKTNMPESNQYFYHSDHLGSASFVTDATGYVDQHIQYLPFGELFISQRNSTFDSRYKFTAKELDNETQYTYFGARYLDSEISIWLSIDPASELYPSTSSYMYVRGNPVVLIDQNGMWDDYFETENGDVVHRNSSEKVIFENGQKLTNIGQTYMEFNGENLTIHSQKRKNEGDLEPLSVSIPAFSGVSDDKNEFDYSAESQATENGPLPEGKYYIKPSEFKVLTSYDQFVGTIINATSQAFGLGKKGAFPGGFRSWGYGRYPIYPQSVTVKNPSTGESVIRTNMFLHGGMVPGSHGCIDVTLFMEPLGVGLNTSNQEQINIYVNY